MFHLSVTAFIPSVQGCKTGERAIANVSRELEKAIKEIAGSITALQEENKLLSQMVIENPLAPDHLLAAQDRVCALLIKAAGFWVNQDQKK